MPELSSSIIYSESTLDIWNDLKERFSQPNGTKIYQLKRSLYECKQAHLSVTAYFTLLKSIWDELASYDSPPPCTCGASKAISSYCQREQVMQFLYGLDETYAPLRGQLLLDEPLPSVTKMYSFVLQEEKQRELSHTTFIKPEASALAANSNNVPRNFTSSRAYSQQPSYSAPKGRPRPHCDHCNNDGHTIATCYKIHGYPPKKQGVNKNFNGSSAPRGIAATTNQGFTSGITPTNAPPPISQDQFRHVYNCCIGVSFLINVNSFIFSQYQFLTALYSEDFALYCKTGILVGRRGQIASFLPLAMKIAGRLDVSKVPVEDMDKFHCHLIAA
ncbi:hypothetical protein RHGRI_019866 [Rhododendron griersonianum]|uniref:Retrotransposon gag domain-containing protein n=1 Tax=Rhododendron griersonianum TaxID=479676 RepID=A0AAV6JJ74_9ERIC|nr:hypothetical protein RHGRI_019866 [Rhododendron griersonianum]